MAEHTAGKSQRKGVIHTSLLLHILNWIIGGSNDWPVTNNTDGKRAGGRAKGENCDSYASHRVPLLSAEHDDEAHATVPPTRMPRPPRWGTAKLRKWVFLWHSVTNAEVPSTVKQSRRRWLREPLLHFVAWERPRHTRKALR